MMIPPPLHQLLRNHFHFFVGDHLVVPIGVSHISLRHKEYNQGSGRKRTNEQYAWVKCKKGDSVTLCIPLCICRLILAWVSSEISTKLLGMPTHLDQSSLTAAGLSRMPNGLSAVRCRLGTRVTLRQLTSLSSFVQLLTRVPLPTSGHVEDHGLRSLFGFAPKQTKGSSAWWTTYIVSQL